MAYPVIGTTELEACLELLGLLSVSKLRFVIINYEKPSTCPTLSSTHSVTLEKRHYSIEQYYQPL